MAQDATERVSPNQLEEGDIVTVHVNNRASGHLETDSFEAEVVDTITGIDVTFEPVDGPLTPDQTETHTWYGDIGYIHGYHKGLERYSDIGKVRKVTR